MNKFPIPSVRTRQPGRLGPSREHLAPRHVAVGRRLPIAAPRRSRTDLGHLHQPRPRESLAVHARRRRWEKFAHSAMIAWQQRDGSEIVSRPPRLHFRRHVEDWIKRRCIESPGSLLQCDEHRLCCSSRSSTKTLLRRVVPVRIGRRGFSDAVHPRREVSRIVWAIEACPCATRPKCRSDSWSHIHRYRAPDIVPHRSRRATTHQPLSLSAMLPLKSPWSRGLPLTKGLDHAPIANEFQMIHGDDGAHAHGERNPRLHTAEGQLIADFRLRPGETQERSIGGEAMPRLERRHPLRGRKVASAVHAHRPEFIPTGPRNGSSRPAMASRYAGRRYRKPRFNELIPGRRAGGAMIAEPEDFHVVDLAQGDVDGSNSLVRVSMRFRDGFRSSRRRDARSPPRAPRACAMVSATSAFIGYKLDAGGRWDNPRTPAEMMPPEIHRAIPGVPNSSYAYSWPCTTGAAWSRDQIRLHAVVGDVRKALLLVDQQGIHDGEILSLRLQRQMRRHIARVLAASRFMCT